MKELKRPIFKKSSRTNEKKEEYQILIFEDERFIFSRLVEDKGQDEVGHGDRPEEDRDDGRKNKLLKGKV